VAENNKCVKREVAMSQHRIIYADHHEWRRLRQCEVVLEESPWKGEGSIFYCIFCLQLKTKRLRDEPTTKHR
jgi:hypothetical protein